MKGEIWLKGVKMTVIHKITKSQSGWDEKGRLETIQSNHLPRAGSATAGCSRLWPAGFWRSPGMETPQSLRSTCSYVWPLSL